MNAIPSSLIEHAGWVLLHSVWQFAAVAVLIYVGNRLLEKASASARYMLLLSGLLLVTIAPVATWFVLPQPLEDTMVAAVEPPALPLLDELSPPGTGAVQRDPAFEYSRGAPPEIANLPVIPTSIAIEDVSAVKWYELLTDVLQPWLSTIVVLWCVGVLLFSVRPVFGWLNVRRLRSVGTSPVAESVQQALQRIAERLHVSRRVEILASTVVTSPMVVGCFRSVILLPGSFIANVPASQLEAILAHELAHVRRYDYLINLLQTLIETLFFYHPAVWWLSYRIRIERENCCDDLVVVTFANKADYGRALLAVEEFRNTPVSTSTLALGAQGGSLLDRVRRLVNPPSQNERAGSAGAVALTVLTIGLLAVGFWASAETQADEEDVTESAEPDSLVVDIADGISLQLLAVHPHNDRTKAWHPNGLPYEGSADLKEWTDTANQFPETARHLMFRWTGLENGSTRTRYKSWGPPRGKSSYFPPRGGIARLITNSAVGQDVLSVQVGLADSNWGPWIRVDKDGEVVASMKIPPECKDAYALVNSCSIEDQGSQSWFCWSGEDRVSDSAQYKIVAVMKDGNRRDYDAGTVRGDSPDLQSVEVFDVPLSQIDHFEYRLRPYRHWVTFNNVARQPGLKTDVKVSVKSIPIPPPDSYVAKLPGGQLIELVGITNNNEPAIEGWKPDGRRQQEGIGEWNPDVLLGDDARDFLFRLDGLKTVPSLRFTLPGRGAHFSYMQPNQLPGPWQLRVGGSLGDESMFEGGYFRQEAGVVQVAMTDESWGKWLQVSVTDGTILNPITGTDKFAEGYAAVKIRRVESLRATSDPRDLPAGLGLTLYRSQQHALGHGFRVRGIDSAGEEVWLVPTSDRREVDGKPAYPVEKTWRLYKPLPKGRTLSRFEFRLRPYRHLVTFENVATESPRDEPSQVKVSVDQLANTKPAADSYMAKLPGGPSIELVGITNNSRPVGEGWKPDGRRLQKGIDMWNPGVVLRGNARDFLFRLDELKTVPSLRFTLPGNEFQYSSMKGCELPGPWRIRVGGSIENVDRPANGLFESKAGVVQVAITDEPWGKWLQFEVDNAIGLNPISINDLYRYYYSGIRILYLERAPTKDPAKGPSIALTVPPYRRARYDFQIRAIDSEGDEHRMGQCSPYRKYPDSLIYPLDERLSEGRTISYFEYRLRPYRHIVTFQNVVTGRLGDEPREVEISVETLPNQIPEQETRTLPILRQLQKSKAIVDLRRLLAKQTIADLRVTKIVADLATPRDPFFDDVQKPESEPRFFEYGKKCVFVTSVQALIGSDDINRRKNSPFRIFPDVAFVFSDAGKILATLGGDFEPQDDQFGDDESELMYLGLIGDCYLPGMKFQYDEVLMKNFIGEKLYSQLPFQRSKSKSSTPN